MEEESKMDKQDFTRIVIHSLYQSNKQNVEETSIRRELSKSLEDNGEISNIKNENTFFNKAKNDLK